MKIKYDNEVDIMTIWFSEKKIVESEEDKKGVIIDYDKDDNIVSIEILNASKKMGNPNSVNYEFA